MKNKIKYGNKRDYKKIDFFNYKYGYISTTTWSKNLKDALNHFHDDGSKTINGVDNTIYAKYQDGKNYYKKTFIYNLYQ